MKKAISILLIFATLFTFTSCSGSKKHTSTLSGTFDTVTTFTAITDDKATFERASDLVKSKLESFNKLFDIYNSYDGIVNLKSVNDAKGEVVKVDEKLASLIDYGVWASSATNGSVNIALGSVLKIWKEYHDNAIKDPALAAVPTKEELEKAAVHTDISKVIVDLDNNTVQLQDSEMSLDVGAIAKGYVADQIAAAVSATGVENFVINLGGNVVARGVDENGSPFKVGIQNPDTKAKETSIYNVELSSESLVTSGSYQRFYTVGDKTYHHIINPKTLFPENYYKSISVLSPSSVLSDNFSTALFNLSIEEGKELLKHFTTVKVLWVKEDGTIEKTDNFPQKK